MQQFISLDAFHGKYYFLKKKGKQKYWVPTILEKTMPDFTRGLTDSFAIPPRSISTVLADKKAIEADLLAKSSANDALEAKLKEVETKLKEAETRLTALRKDLLQKKREWREQNDALSKELSNIRSATTSVAAKAIAMTNERVSYDSELRKQLQGALQINESHNKAMMELNEKFVEVMSTVSGEEGVGNGKEKEKGK